MRLLILDYAAFYTSLIWLVFPVCQLRGECIKSSPFIHMQIKKNILFMVNICYYLNELIFYTFIGVIPKEATSVSQTRLLFICLYKLFSTGYTIFIANSLNYRLDSLYKP